VHLIIEYLSAAPGYHFSCTVTPLLPKSQSCGIPPHFAFITYAPLVSLPFAAAPSLCLSTAGVFFASVSIISATACAFSRFTSSSAGSASVSRPPKSQSSWRSRTRVDISREVLIYSRASACRSQYLPTDAILELKIEYQNRPARSLRVLEIDVPAQQSAP
jgi:hypothetical protein